MTNKEIEDVTGIVIDPDHDQKYTLIDSVNKRKVGVVRRDARGWRFQPRPVFRYSYTDLRNIAETVYMINRRDKIV